MKLDVTQLRQLYLVGIKNGTEQYMVPIMFEWAEEASRVAKKYRDALNKIAEKGMGDHLCLELIQIAREALKEDV